MEENISADKVKIEGVEGGDGVEDSRPEKEPQMLV
jgi:hypothetical protein